MFNPLASKDLKCKELNPENIVGRACCPFYDTAFEAASYMTLKWARVDEGITGIRLIQYGRDFGSGSRFLSSY